MQEYHVVAYNSQGGRVLHPEFVIAEPNLSQDTRVTTSIVNQGTLRITIWWMYDNLAKSLEATFTEQIIRDVQRNLSGIRA